MIPFFPVLALRYRVPVRDFERKQVGVRTGNLTQALLAQPGWSLIILSRGRLSPE